MNDIMGTHGQTDKHHAERTDDGYFSEIGFYPLLKILHAVSFDQDTSGYYRHCHGEKDNINKEANFENLDITNYEKLKELILEVKPKAVYHLAANATTRESSMGWDNPIFDYEVNTFGTLNLLRAADELESKPHFVYASSAAVYGEPRYTPMDEEHPTNPQSPYGVSKLSSEKYLLAYQRERDIPATILRIFNCYGPRQPRYVMFDFLKKLKENPDELEVIGTGDQVRTYCYVSDAVEGIINAADEEASGEVFNLAGGDVITISELAEKIVETMGLEDRTDISYTGESWEGDIVKLVADSSKIEEDLGFETSVGLEEGLSNLKDWFEEVY